MASKLKSREAIVGFGALVWGIASVTLQLLSVPEGVRVMWASPLGIFTIGMFGLGTLLILWGIFKHETGFSEKETIVKQRQENLPLLCSSVDSILKRQREVALEIGKIPLQVFFENYLQKSKHYRVFRKLLNALHKSDAATKHKVATLIALRSFFFDKPVCLTGACNNDDDMARLRADMAIYYHRNNDRKLSSIIDQLLYAATKYHSALAWGVLTMNNELSYTSAQKYAVLEEKPEILKGFLSRAYKAMNERMAFLMRGGDL